MLSTVETTTFEIGRLCALDPSGRPLVSTGRSGEDDSETAGQGLRSPNAN